MKATDQYGLELSTQSPAAADAYVEALDLWLRLHLQATDRFVVALGHDPGFALARAAVASQLQFEPDLAPAVSQALAASRHATHASRRERQHVDIVRRTVARDWGTALRLAVAHLDEFPRDVRIVWQLVLLLGYGGGADRKARAAAELGRLAPRFGEDPWFLGKHGLALSEHAELTPAERLVDRGLALDPTHAVLAHSRAHICFEVGDDRGGRDFLSGWLAEHGEQVVNAGHLSWHLALAEMAARDPHRALDLYRERSTAGLHLRLDDAASLLWRLHLRGVDVGAEWQPLADRRPSAGPTHAFELAHVALVRAGLGDDEGLARLAASSGPDALPPAEPRAQVLIALVDGLRHVVAGRWRDAVPPLEAVASSAPRLGGSNEQQAVFHETLAVAYRGAGQVGEARQVEQQQLAGRAVVPAAAYSDTSRVAL